MVRILADSTCDLSPELVERYGIGIIPLYVHLGKNEYKHGVDISPDELYRWSDEHKICKRRCRSKGNGEFAAQPL